jgi:hypothetical protein
VLLFLVPGYLRFAVNRRAKGGDGLEMLRQVWASFAAALLLIGVVALVIAPGLSRASATPWLPALAVATTALLAAEHWALERPLVCTDLPALAASYRSRFFLAVAFSEAVALFAFVGTVVTGRSRLYWLFLPFSLLGHFRTAPTPGRLRRAQDGLSLQGCPLSLVRALRTPSAS